MKCTVEKSCKEKSHKVEQSCKASLLENVINLRLSKKKKKNLRMQKF